MCIIKFYSQQCHKMCNMINLNGQLEPHTTENRKENDKALNLNNTTIPGK